MKREKLMVFHLLNIQRFFLNRKQKKSDKLQATQYTRREEDYRFVKSMEKYV